MKHFIVRGIVGAGKTEVSKCLAERYNGLRLSTDEVRRDVRFRDSVRFGDKFREDPAFKAQQVFVYELMLAAARRIGDVGRAVQEAVDYVPILCDEMYNVYGQKQDYRMLLTPNERDMSISYLQRKLSMPCDTIICESTFNKVEYIERFCKFFTPYILDVSASKSNIRKRLKEAEKKGERGESMAGLPVFEKLLPNWKSARKLGYHAHEIRNNGEKDKLGEKIEKTLKNIADCMKCGIINKGKLI